MANNHITSKSTRPLTMTMLKINTLNRIELNDNPISDDKISLAVFKHIRTAREKQPHSITVNSEFSNEIH